MNFAWTQIGTISNKVAAFKKYKWRILAVTVFLVIFSPVVVVTYLSNQEQPLYMEDNQRILLTEPPTATSDFGEFPKFYKVVLESTDDVQGTAHLRAELIMRTPGGKALPLLRDIYIHKQLPTGQNPVPVEVLFGPFTIQDEWEHFPSFGPVFASAPEASAFLSAPAAIYGGSIPGVKRPKNFSESAPTSTQADVLLFGNPWWYPFDRYLLAARVDCVVVATADREEYFRVISDASTFASKLPNFIVRVPNAKDVGYWVKWMDPYLKDDQVEEKIKLYQTDVWRVGVICLTLTRPLFPRFLAVFFGIVALAWIAVVANVSDPKQLSLNVFGYFLAMWAIRAPLAAGAPTGPLFMDYVTLGLYALLIAVEAARFIWIRKT